MGEFFAFYLTTDRPINLFFVVIGLRLSLTVLPFEVGKSGNCQRIANEIELYSYMWV